jgi:ATP-dependent Clp protease ATP-binding subunit ClpX
MYEVPSRRDVAQVLITAESVKEHANPTLIPRDSRRPAPTHTPREKSA